MSYTDICKICERGLVSRSIAVFLPPNLTDNYMSFLIFFMEHSVKHRYIKIYLSKNDSLDDINPHYTLNLTNFNVFHDL